MIALAVFGAVVFAAGVRGLVQQPSHWFYAVVLMILGGPSFLAGLSAIVGRSRFEVDRGNGVVIEQRGSFFGRRENRHALGDIDAVVLVRFWAINKASTPEQKHDYRLHLAAPDDRRIELAERLSRSDALAAAACVGRFLDLSLYEEDGRAEGVVAGR